MLDPRVRTVLTEYLAGRCDVEQAAQVLLHVRRETGCLELHASATTAPAQRLLVQRYDALVRAEFGQSAIEPDTG